MVTLLYYSDWTS